MAPKPNNPEIEDLGQEPTHHEQVIQDLQESLTAERDARRKDRFLFIVVAVLLLDIVFFSVMPTLGGPLAMLVLELVILLPVAQRMGMAEIAQVLSRILDRVTTKEHDGE